MSGCCFEEIKEEVQNFINFIIFLYYFYLNLFIFFKLGMGIGVIGDWKWGLEI